MSIPLADPIFEQVSMNPDRGYEYIAPDGSIQGPFPAIAILTWGMKGYLSSDFKIRRAGRVELHRLEELEREILLIARVQVSNLMLHEKEWFYVDSQKKVQGPFSKEQMVSFIGTRYMTEAVQFYGRPFDEGHLPPPNSDSAEFKAFGDLLSESMVHCRQHLVEESKQDENGIMGSEENASELSFEELKSRYLDKAFEDDSVEWYTFENDDCYGPIKVDAETADQFYPHLKLAAVEIGADRPKPYHFLTFQDYLLSFHNVKSVKN